MQITVQTVSVLSHQKVTRLLGFSVGPKTENAPLNYGLSKFDQNVLTQLFVELEYDPQSTHLCSPCIISMTI